MKTNLIEKAVENNEINLKKLIDSVKDTVSFYVIDRASTRVVVRKVGYNGFTVCYTYFRPNETWSSEGFSETPENIKFMIDNYGKKCEESEFYKASKCVSNKSLTNQ